MSTVRPRRATPRRRTAPRWDAADWESATHLLLVRCGFRCERCGDPLGNELERHHRQRREQGGDRLANIVALHTRCHAYVHAHPEEAKAAGLIVSSHHPDPAEVPIRLPGLSGTALWVLRDDGTKRAVL